MGKNLNNKYGQRLLIVLKNLQQTQSKLLQKEQLTKQQKQLIGNKIADKKNVSKSLKRLYSNALHLKTDENEIDMPKEKYISTGIRQAIIDELR